jgi:hypothetical protein
MHARVAGPVGRGIGSRPVTEWLVLLLAAAAIVVPVVLLFGFAGCDAVFDLTHIPKRPLIVSATGTAVDTIAVEWTFNFDSPTKFQLERDGIIIPPDIDPAERTFEDSGPGLAEGSEHSYRVRAFFGDDPTDWSPAVLGKTLTFLPSFSAVLGEDERLWEDYCLVQRIEPERLLRRGPQVRITIRSWTAAGIPDPPNLIIDSIFISQPAPGGDPYDSGADLTQVASAVTVPADTSRVLPPLRYALDDTQPLLVAVDFSSTPGSGNVRRATGSEATAFYKQNVRQAAMENRDDDYVLTDAVVLVEKIEVAAEA